MKLLNLLVEELAEFDQPEQTDAGKLRFIQTKVKSLSHHKTLLISKDVEFENLVDKGKMTPDLRQRWEIVKAKLKQVETQFKQFDIKIGKNKITNPLAQCELALYVGSPEQYPDLTRTQVTILAGLQLILAEAGMKPLTILYGGRRSHVYRGINFVAVNADNTFAWRKYDPSPASGQNAVYFAGAQKTGSVFDSKTQKHIKKTIDGTMNTSDFLAEPEKYLPAKNAVAGAP